MNILKTITIVFFFLITSSLLFAQGAEKTLVKSFNLKGDNIVLLDLEGDIDVQEWKGDLLRIQINLNLTNGTSSMLKSLIVAGRYNLISSNKDGEVIVSAPGLKKDVKVGGKLLAETISYTVFAPNDVMVKIADESSTKLENDNASPSSL